MIKKLITLLIVISMSILPSCKKQKEYLPLISQLRHDVFIYKCDDFKLTAYVESVENPIKEDGKVGKLENVITFKMQALAQNFESLSISFKINGESYSKQFEFKQIASLSTCKIAVTDFPSKSFKANLKIDDQLKTVELVSAKNSSTKDYLNAVDHLADSEENFATVIKNKNCELRIRLIDNDGYDYWFIGVVSTDKKLSYLLDGETLEIIAKKVG